MAVKPKRVRRKEVGFVGVNLAKDGDMTLYNRFEEEVKSDPELSRSLVIRLALKEYFEKRDNQKTE